MTRQLRTQESGGRRSRTGPFGVYAGRDSYDVPARYPRRLSQRFPTAVRIPSPGGPAKTPTALSRCRQGTATVGEEEILLPRGPRARIIASGSWPLAGYVGELLAGTADNTASERRKPPRGRLCIGREIAFAWPQLLLPSWSPTSSHWVPIGSSPRRGSCHAHSPATDDDRSQSQGR